MAIEAAYGWYWAVGALQAAKFDVRLAHPYGMKAMRKRKRVKTDARDAYELANLLRLGSLPEGYIAPQDLRELRELVRHRRQLTKTATSVKAQIRALLAKHGVRQPPSALESQAGQDQLEAVRLPDCAAGRLESRRRLMMMLDNEIDALDVELDRRLKTHPGYRNLLKVKGIGPVLAAIFVVGIGDVTPLQDRRAAGVLGGNHPAALRVRPDRALIIQRDTPHGFMRPWSSRRNAWQPLAVVDLDIEG